MSLLGHVLRRDRAIPVNQAIDNYFRETNVSKYRGRNPNNIAITTDNDIRNHFVIDSIIDHDYYQRNFLQLQNYSDIDIVRRTAEDRTVWRKYTSTH